MAFSLLRHPKSLVNTNAITSKFKDMMIGQQSAHLSRKQIQMRERLQKKLQKRKNLQFSLNQIKKKKQKEEYETIDFKTACNILKYHQKDYDEEFITNLTEALIKQGLPNRVVKRLKSGKRIASKWGGYVSM